MSYTSIMKAFDKLLDEMEHTNPNDMSIVQQFDIYFYVKNHLKAKLKTICPLAQLIGMKQEEAASLVEKHGMYMRALRTLENGEVVKMAKKHQAADLRLNRLNVIVKEGFVFEVVDIG